MLNQLKISNIKNIMLCLLAEKRATKQILGQKTAISNTTVSDTINSMLKLGLVVTNGNETSIGGRRSAIYSINHNYGQFLGLELRVGRLIYVVCDSLGKILLTRTLLGEENELPIQLLYRAVEDAVSHGITPNLLSIGIGVEGSISYEHQIILDSRELDWQNVHLKEIVERRFYVPTYIDSAVNGQIPLAFYAKDPGCPKDLMVLHEDFPTKAAISLNGTILRGARNLCGALADPDTLLGNMVSSFSCWDVSRLIIRFQSLQYGKRMQALADSLAGRQAEILAQPLNKEDLAQGMALLAETKWFNSIYFLLE